MSASDQDSTVHIAELQAMAEEPFASGGFHTSTVPNPGSAGVDTTTATTSPSSAADADSATDATTTTDTSTTDTTTP